MKYEIRYLVGKSLRRKYIMAETLDFASQKADALGLKWVDVVQVKLTEREVVLQEGRA